MRTLYEIIESAKDGDKPTHDECYWAMLALSGLHYFDQNVILDFGMRGKELDSPFGMEYQAEETIRRFRNALNKSPKEFVGVENDPSNPDYQRMRKIALGVYRKIDGRSRKEERE